MTARLAVDTSSSKRGGAAEPTGEQRAAIVLFGGDTQLRCLRILQPGFRHCLVAVSIGTSWVIIDPLSHKTALSVAEGFSADELVRWYEGQGLKAVRTVVREAPAKLAPLIVSLGVV